MKGILSLLPFMLVLLLAHPAQSQEQPKVIVGLHNQFIKQQHAYRWNFMPMAGWQQQRHQLTAGPVLLMKDFSGAIHFLPRLTGLQLAYRYQLTQDEHKAIKVFAEVTSSLQRIQERWTSNYWHEEEQRYLDVEQGSRELLWQSFAGIGAKYALHPSLHLHTSAGLGYSSSGLKKIGTSPNSNDNVFDYRQYDARSMSYSLSLGLFLILGH